MQTNASVYAGVGDSCSRYTGVGLVIALSLNSFFFSFSSHYNQVKRMSNNYSVSLSAYTNFTIHKRVTATCKLEKYTIKKGNLSRHFQSRCYLQIGVSSSYEPQEGCLTMILNLDALQLNVSHFGRKYLQNNGFHEMAGLRTKASFMAHMVRKRWCGDPGL